MEQNAAIYVGGLAQEVSEADLYDTFNAVGPVASCKICRDVATKKSRGYGFVNFHKSTDAERAIDTMNFVSIRGQPVRIMWSNRDRTIRENAVGNIVVKNLDRSIDNKTLFDTFSMFGDILSCKVGTDKSGESLGYGFVHYASPDAAQQAIKKINGMLLAEKRVTVEPYKKLASRTEEEEKSFTNVYITKIPTNMTEAEVLKEVKKFGKIESSVFPANENGTLKGYGYADFANHRDAEDCVNELSAEGMTASRALSKSERAKKRREEQASSRTRKTNLYVKNIADEIGEEELASIFNKFGQTTSVKIMKKPDGSSKGFGFVAYGTEEEASKAMSELNDTEIAGKRLYVGLAQNKAERTQFLAKKFGSRRQQQNQFSRHPPFAGFPAYQMRGISSYGAMPNYGYGQAFPMGMPLSMPPRRPKVLDSSSLMGKSQAEVKQMLGEKLYSLVTVIDPMKAGKITGMLLEMDPTEILHLIDNKNALLKKVNEAILVLNKTTS